MKANAKYLFDEDFSPGEKLPTITLVEAERRRADAESLAYRKGFAAGQEQAQNGALGLIADGMERLDKALAGIEARLETEAVEVAVAVAGKLAPELIAREPFAEISALATESFNHLVKAPHVVVHIGAEAFEPAKVKLEEIAHARGFEGRRWCRPIRPWRPVTAASNGPMAASPATAPRPLRRSMTWSPATWRPEIALTNRNSGDRRNE